ncbi:MAG: hypothetical protein ACK53Y_13445, partial [bacterium]
NTKKKSAKYYWLNMLGLHYLLAEGDIGAPIYWQTDAPRAITITSPRVGQNKINKIKRRTKQFGAPHLFSSQSPINSPLQTGNGNTLKKRRRPH